jgi:hypothetical protein
MTIPTYLPYFMMAGTAATLIAIHYGLHRSFTETTWPAETRNRTFLVTLIVLGGWFLLSLALGTAGFYHMQSGGKSHDPIWPDPADRDRCMADLALGNDGADHRRDAAALADWYSTLPRARRGLSHPLCRRQAARPLRLARRHRRYGSWSHCPLVGLAYAKAPLKTAGLVRTWNALGILDLTVAVTTGFLTAPSLFQAVDVQPNSELMSVLPMVLIPIYLVPLSIVLHLASLAKLHRTAA